MFPEDELDLVVSRINRSCPMPFSNLRFQKTDAHKLTEIERRELALLARILVGITHDLNSPLFRILGFPKERCSAIWRGFNLDGSGELADKDRKERTHKGFRLCAFRVSNSVSFP